MQDPQARASLEPRIHTKLAEQPLALDGWVRVQCPRSGSGRRLDGDAEGLRPVPNRRHHVLADAELNRCVRIKEGAAARTIKRLIRIADRDVRLVQPPEAWRERLVRGESSR